MFLKDLIYICSIKPLDVIIILFLFRFRVNAAEKFNGEGGSDDGNIKSRNFFLSHKYELFFNLPINDFSINLDIFF